MTWNNQTPNRHNRRTWTAYERRCSTRPATGFDLDGHSCQHGRGLWPDIGDVEDLTILAGLSDPAQSPDDSSTTVENTPTGSDDSADSE